MTEQQPDSFDTLWRESIKNHVAAMTDGEFADLVTQTRPHTAGIENPLTTRNLADPADRRRAVLGSIQDKQRRLKPKPEDVDANGYRKEESRRPTEL
jgi:hypothetical protein